jgi:hypothetical protein
MRYSPGMSSFRPLWSLVLALGLTLLCSAAHAKKDRLRLVELQPMIGYSWVNLTGISEDQFYQSVNQTRVDASSDPTQVLAGSLADSQIPVEGQGPSFGAALQLKLWVFVLSGRYAYTAAEDFGLHTVGADLGLRLGGIVSIYGRLGPGWAFQSGLPEGINVDGFAVSSSAGLEFRLGRPISLGIGFDADLLLLASQGQLQLANDAAGGNVTASQLRELDGTAVGFQLRPQLHLIWHI